MKKKAGIKSIVVSFILAILVFAVLLIIEGALLDDYEKASVVIASKDIPAYTEITDSNIDNYFEVIQIPKDIKIIDAYTSIEEVKNIILEHKIQKGEQLTKSKIISVQDQVLLNYKNPVSVSHKVENLSFAVSGTLVRGDVVDIVAIDQMSKEIKVLKQNVFILGAYDSSGNEVTTINASDNASVIFNFLMERDEYESFLEGVNAATIKLVKVENVE